MDFISIAVSILVITLLIIVHEFGHFLVAKYYGFQAPVFGIGLPIGPGINLFKRWGTQFKFYWFLIGGFVAIPELGDETDEESIKKYNVKLPLKEFPVKQRMLVASGGIIFNILFALILAIIMAATIGIPKILPGTKIANFSSPNAVGKLAGLQLEDTILAINSTQIHSGTELQKSIQETKGQKIKIKIQRKQRELDISLNNPGLLGISLSQEKTYEKYGFKPFTWLRESIRFTITSFIAMLISVVALLGSLVTKILAIIIPNLNTGADLGQVKGIVGIVQIISKDIHSNLWLILEFGFLLSLNLAVINLLPIPALDGGHLAFMTYEAIAGKKACEKFQASAVQIGFVFLLVIIALTTVNDIKTWVFG